MTKRLNIIIAEPSAIIRCGLVTLMQRVTSFSGNIAEVSDISSLISSSFKVVPDLLIINPSHLGLFSLSDLRGSLGNAELKVVAMQSTIIEQSLLQSYDGAFSIYDSIEAIAEKILEVTKEEQLQEDKRELSAREKEIIVSVVKGMTNKQIADVLCLSTHTVIAHRRNIASKLQIHSPSGLTIYAIVNKLVDLADIKSSISQNREE